MSGFFVNTGGLALEASVQTVDTVADAIKAKTDNLPPDPADASDIAASFATVNTKLDTIDDFVDTEVAAIKAKTDNLPANPASATNLDATVSSRASQASVSPANVESARLNHAIGLSGSFSAWETLIASTARESIHGVLTVSYLNNSNADVGIEVRLAQGGAGSEVVKFHALFHVGTNTIEKAQTFSIPFALVIAASQRLSVSALTSGGAAGTVKFSIHLFG
jgi:hypothetical protein